MELDKRLVQTAVLGAAGSRDPVIMPMTRFEALDFLGAYPRADFWCGTWLGGCGKQLQTRVGMERIPHFAHWPDRRGRVACHRQHNDRRSADHLFVNRDLRAWAYRHGRHPAEPVLHGEFADGGTCVCLEIALHAGAGAGDGLVTVVFRGYDQSVWYRDDAPGEPAKSLHSWMFGPGVSSPQALLDRDGYALHVRLDSTDAVGRIEIGTRPPRGGIEWVGLDDCTLDDRGVTTPYVPDLRRKRTIIAAPTAPTPKPAPVRIAPGRAVPPLTFRRAVLRIGRGYGMDGDAERAGLCARLGRTTDPARAHVPEWLWADVRPALGVPAPHPAARSSIAADTAPALVALDPALDAIPLDEQLVDFVAELGCPVYDDVHRLRWLRLATAHVSYLYESSASEFVSRDVPPALGELAKRHVRMAVLDRYVASHQPAKVGQQSEALAVDERRAWAAIAALPVLREVANFGRGESLTAREGSSKSRLAVMQQVVGVVALFGGHPAVRRVVDRAIAAAPDTQDSPAETRISLAQLVDERQLHREWGDRTGPDHDPRYTVRITDSRGRTAVGTGRSKKTANHAAEDAFVRQWLSDVTIDRGATGAATRPREAPRSYGRLSRDHSAAVDTLAAMFDLPRAAHPYTTQALTHSSWAYEHQREVRLANQQDNRLLAHQGSVVADLLVADRHVRGALGRTATPEPGELIQLTPEERVWRELFSDLQLEPGLLLGAGEQPNPVPSFAGAMQAVLAVAWRFKGPQLLSAPPAAIGAWVRANGPTQDAATRLQNICGTFDIQLAFEVSGRGPDNLRQYAATAELDAHGARLRVAGAWGIGVKTLARRRCAERVLRVLLETTHSGPWNLSDEERRVARFLLRAQLANAAQVAQRNLERCCLQGHLGLSFVLAGDDEAYGTWSAQVGELISDRPTRSDPRLVDLYRRAAEVAR